MLIPNTPEKKKEYPETAAASAVSKPVCINSQGTKIYRARKFDLAATVMYGYVFDEKCWDLVSAMLNDAKIKRYDNVLSYVLCKHKDAICDNLWEDPKDHWHLLVWYKAGKPTDTRFHRTFFKGGEKGVSWNSSLIRVPMSMM